MCLYPRKLTNKKYVGNNKNGGIPPEAPIIGYNDLGLPIYDLRVLQINVPCGQCIECRKTKAREWQVRLTEEIKTCKYPYFITLTFAPKELEELCKKTRLKECNAVAGYAVRHMLERYRKDHKKSIKHWLITELGHEGTERIHLHGLLLGEEPLEFSKSDTEGFYSWKYWKYGLIYVGSYCNLQTINYIVKYINKIDNDHKGFVGQILASPGLGKQFIDKIHENQQEARYSVKKGTYRDFYKLDNGAKIKMPKYYKNKLVNEEEREQLWREFMDKEQITIAGNTYTRDTKEETIQNIRWKAQEINKALDYGDDSQEWRKKDYNVTKRMLQQVEREKAKKQMIEALMRKNKQKLVELGIEI